VSVAELAWSYQLDPDTTAWVVLLPLPSLTASPRPGPAPANTRGSCEEQLMDSSTSGFLGILTYFWREDKLNSGASVRQRERCRWHGLGCRYHCPGWLHEE